MWVLAVLFALPVLLYVVVGTYALWKTGFLIYLWWVLPLCWLATYLVGYFWAPPKTEDAVAPTAGHWTPRDREAAKIVLKYQEEVHDFSAKEMTDLHFYVRRFESLSNELATHYHPDADDPFSSLTIPELAAAIRLVADDLEQLVLKSLPGSKLLTVKQWRSFGDTPKWVSRAKNTAWASSILINPMNLVRYGLSKSTIEKVSSGIQSEVLASIYLRFIRQVGFYLIEMNSGRLRGGADTYRTAFESGGQGAGAAVDDDGQIMDSITLGIIGQPDAGKTSLIETVTYGSDVKVESLKGTSYVKRHSVVSTSDDASDQLNAVFLDSPGCEGMATSSRRWKDIETVVMRSDIVLLVIDVNDTDWDCDVETLFRIDQMYAASPNLKPVPVIVVLTHIDLLPPSMEWSPPYDFNETAQPSEKEKSISVAIKKAESLFSKTVAEIVPVSTGKTHERRWGVIEFLMPAILRQVKEGKTAAMVAAFEKTLNSGWAKSVFSQFAHGGKQLAKLWLQKKFRRFGE